MPIAATLLETAAWRANICGADAFSSWSAAPEEAMVVSGIDPARSWRLAMLTIAGLEGAIVQSHEFHVFRSEQP